MDLIPQFAPLSRQGESLPFSTYFLSKIALQLPVVDTVCVYLSTATDLKTVGQTFSDLSKAQVLVVQGRENSSGQSRVYDSYEPLAGIVGRKWAEDIRSGIRSIHPLTD